MFYECWYSVAESIMLMLAVIKDYESVITECEHIESVPEFLNLDMIVKQWLSTSRHSCVNKVSKAWCSPEHMWAFSKDRKTSRGCISSRALLCSLGSGSHINAGYRAALFWCDSIVSPGQLNAVPSQHCSPEALKHFGDKHRLAVKRATEEKAYQMCPQWAVSCIMRPGPQIRWSMELDAWLQDSVPQHCYVIRLLWNSAGGVFSSLRPLHSTPLHSSPIQLWDIRAQWEERERREERRGSLAFRFCPCPFSCSAFWG